MTHTEQVRQETRELEQEQLEASRAVDRLEQELATAKRRLAVAKARLQRRRLWTRAEQLRSDLEATEAEAARITIADGYNQR